MQLLSIAIISLVAADEEEMNIYSTISEAMHALMIILFGGDKKLSCTYSCFMLVLVVHDKDQSLVA